MDLSTVDLVMAGLFLLGAGSLAINMAMPADKKIIDPGSPLETGAMAISGASGGWLAVRALL